MIRYSEQPTQKNETFLSVNKEIVTTLAANGYRGTVFWRNLYDVQIHVSQTRDCSSETSYVFVKREKETFNFSLTSRSLASDIPFSVEKMGVLFFLNIPQYSVISGPQNWMSQQIHFDMTWY